MTNSKTYSVCDAYIEEFTYYALEAPNSFIKLSKELFIENHGKPEAKDIDWNFVHGYFKSIARKGCSI